MNRLFTRSNFFFFSTKKKITNFRLKKSTKIAIKLLSITWFSKLFQIISTKKNNKNKGPWSSAASQQQQNTV